MDIFFGGEMFRIIFFSGKPLDKITVTTCKKSNWKRVALEKIYSEKLCQFHGKEALMKYFLS